MLDKSINKTACENYLFEDYPFETQHRGVIFRNHDNRNNCSRRIGSIWEKFLWRNWLDGLEREEVRGDGRQFLEGKKQSYLVSWLNNLFLLHWRCTTEPLDRFFRIRSTRLRRTCTAGKSRLGA